MGTKVYHAFEDKYGVDREYVGWVVGYDPKTRWFRVRYTDGDGHEKTASEIATMLEPTALHEDEDDDADAVLGYGVDLWKGDDAADAQG